ncbi:MAG: hypothetical protein GKS03_11780 [Alphaproteobacteria bacterium]|nr:hypothetical protein [Alphaproteobacteria bacterium]
MMKIQRFLNIVPALLVLAMGVVAVYPYILLDGRFILDADIQVVDIKLYYQTFRDWSWGALPKPSANVYFQGHTLIYGFVLNVYEGFTGSFSAESNLDHLALVSASTVNAAAHVLATAIFFMTVKRLTAQVWIALLITALFAFSPQVLDITLIRIDRLMLLPLVVVLHVSVVIAQQEAGWRHGIAIGVALALLTATKISGVLFGVFPATAMLAVLATNNFDRRIWRRMGMLSAITLAAALPVLCILMVRFVLHANSFGDILLDGYDMQMRWTSVLPFTPILYYNVDLFLGYGVLFLTVSLLSIGIVAVSAATQKSPVCIWLISNITLFSIAGAIAFKFERGGYHLVPLYLFAIAIAYVQARDWLAGRSSKNVQLRYAAACVIALVIPVGAVALSFATSSQVALQRIDSITQTRIESREWIAAQFSPADRVCMMTSTQWANPQLDGLGLRVTTRPFDFPYLDKEAMATYVNPGLYQVRAACDAIVFNDAHTDAYMGNFRSQGHEQRLEEWLGVLEALKSAYPPTVFKSETVAYYVSRVEVYDLRRDPVNADQRFGPAGFLSRAIAVGGILEDDAMRFGERALPIVIGRYRGSIDRVVRYDDNSMLAQGWAVDTRGQEPAAAVLFVAGSQVIAFEGTATARRRDVAASLGASRYLLSGYAACLFTGTNSPDRVRVFALGQDGTIGEIGPTTGIEIEGVPADLVKPSYCRLS